jgi:hypothetical protein
MNKSLSSRKKSHPSSVQAEKDRVLAVTRQMLWFFSGFVVDSALGAVNCLILPIDFIPTHLKPRTIVGRFVQRLKNHLYWAIEESYTLMRISGSSKQRLLERIVG